MLEAVPLRVERRVRDPVRARQVDDHAVGRRLELGGAPVRGEEEDDARAAPQRLVVRDEHRQRSVAREARVERGRRLSGLRVGAERDRLELRVVEDAVERLLSGVAGATEDGGREHLAYYARP